MLKTLDFLQIGDVHYPNAIAEKLGDFKDPDFPEAVANLAAVRPLTFVARKLSSIIRKPPHTVILNGDLTTYGDSKGYVDCIEYLNKLLNFTRLTSNRLHVVPGNHDVDRSKVDPSGDLRPKFSDFENAWSNIGFPILAVDKMRRTSLAILKKPASGATVFSVNSSLGCGERRYPKEIRNQLDAWLDSYAANATKSEAFTLLGETLDTPAFDLNQINELCADIGDLAPTSIPLIVAHHNILPQALPRIDVYTDLINAGIVRSRLSHLQRPILYCHGHIHDNPVEIISEPGYPGSKVICIAAPTFSSGFNTISIEFSGNGMPLGCVVNCFAISPRDGEVRESSIRIPFYLPSYAVAQSIRNPMLLRILANLPEGGLRFPELTRKLRPPEVDTRDTACALLEGEWLGMLSLRDKQEKPEYWFIEKVIR